MRRGCRSETLQRLVRSGQGIREDGQMGRRRAALSDRYTDQPHQRRARVLHRHGTGAAERSRRGSSGAICACLRVGARERPESFQEGQVSDEFGKAEGGTGRAQGPQGRRARRGQRLVPDGPVV